MMKMLRDFFTLPGLPIIGVLVGGAALFFWFLWTINQARAGETPIRAITAAEHDACANMPRGNQEMENGRQQCFNELYGSGGFKIDRELMGRDR